MAVTACQGRHEAPRTDLGLPQALRSTDVPPDPQLYDGSRTPTAAQAVAAASEAPVTPSLR